MSEIVVKRVMRHVTREDVLLTAQRFFNRRGIVIDCSSGDPFRIAESWAESLSPNMPHSASFAIIYPERALEYQSGSGRTRATLWVGPDYAAFEVYDLTNAPEHQEKLEAELRAAWPEDLVVGGPGYYGVAEIQRHATLVGFIRYHC